MKYNHNSMEQKCCVGLWMPPDSVLPQSMTMAMQINRLQNNISSCNR